MFGLAQFPHKLSPAGWTALGGLYGKHLVLFVPPKLKLPRRRGRGGSEGKTIFQTKGAMR